MCAGSLAAIDRQGETNQKSKGIMLIQNESGKDITGL